MKSTLFLLTILSVLLTGCFNPKEKAMRKNMSSLGSDEATNMSLLWRIDGKGVKSPSYIFGTMHLIQKEYWTYPESLQKRIEEAKLITMEVAEMPSPAEAMKLVMLEEGSLFDYFNDAQEDTLFTFLEEKAGLNKEMVKMSFSKMKPFAVVQLATAQQIAGETESYELTIMNLAKEKNIETAGLETMEEQMALFDNLTKDEQTEMVMSAIRDYDKTANDLIAMQKLYANGRIDSLYTLVKLESNNMGVEKDDILKNRNENWIPQIKKMIKKQNTFIAVGAAHLGGPEGVLNLLRLEGYTVTAVKL